MWNKVLRSIVNVPWYFRNTDHHRDLETDTVNQTVKQFHRNYEEPLLQHRNRRGINLLRWQSQSEVEHRAAVICVKTFIIKLIRILGMLVSLLIIHISKFKLDKNCSLNFCRSYCSPVWWYLFKKCKDIFKFNSPIF